MKKEDILNNVRALLKSTSTIKGHFSSDLIDLGNHKWGVDIFVVSIKGHPGNKYLHLSGIYKTGVKKLLETLGVFNKKVLGAHILIHKENNVISEVPLIFIKELVNEYLSQLPPLALTIGVVQETFTKHAQREVFYRQENIVLNGSFLEYLQLETSPIISDTTDRSFICFNNGVLDVSQEGVLKRQYAELGDLVVWKEQITGFDIQPKPKGKSQFERFVANVCSKDPSRIKALRSAMGYLMHSYHRQSGGQMVMLYDEQITDLDNPQGGTGKGVIANAIKAIRNTVKVDGKKLDGKGRFDFQDVQLDTNVVWVDDVGKQLNIDRFNSISTDGFNIEQKFKDSIHIPAEESPKIIICSNIIMDCSGTTRRRRQFIIELSSYYSSKIQSGVEEPIIEEHGCRFFSNEWDNPEWNKFYWYMIDCLHKYLKEGLAPVPSINVANNRSRQTIGEDLHNWLEQRSFNIKEKYRTKDLFKEYKDLYEPNNDRFSQRTFSNKLKQYFALKNKQIKFDVMAEDGEKVSVFRISN